MSSDSQGASQPQWLAQPARSGPPAAARTGPARITDRLVGPIRERLLEGKAVRRSLPVWGRLHVDRQLPFLSVFRRREDDPESGTEDLLLGEAAYLLAPGQRAYHSGLVSLLDANIESQLPSFGAFLVIEIWSSPSGRVHPDQGPEAPRFRIFRTRESAISSTVEVLERALSRITIRAKPAAVELVRSSRIAPPELQPLLRASQAAERGVQLLGIEVPEIFRHAETGDLLPQVRRALHRGFSRALKRACFEFTRSQTTHRPPHFHALGRRSMVKAVWEVDRQLAEVSTSFDLLLLATPTNTDAAWGRFHRKHCEVAPQFTYRPLPIDPSLVKRSLWSIPVERIEDPTLEDLFREQQDELDRKITMLGDRGTPRFRYGSLQLFGSVDDALLAQAQALLDHIPPRSRETAKGAKLDAAAFAARAEAELEHLRAGSRGLPARVRIRRDVSGLMVSRGHLLVPAKAHIPAARVDALLQHEVGTHIVTYYNGDAQPFRQLRNGLPGYEELQEGLAVLAEYLVGGLSRVRLRILAARVLAVRWMIDGASFVDVFRKLDRDYDFANHTAYIIAMRVFRGGGQAKDAVYLRGLAALLDYLGGGGSLDPLLVGKIGLQHLEVVKELQFRQVLVPPRFRPRYLELPEAKARLEKLRGGARLMDLATQKKRRTR